MQSAGSGASSSTHAPHAAAWVPGEQVGGVVHVLSPFAPFVHCHVPESPPLAPEAGGVDGVGVEGIEGALQYGKSGVYEHSSTGAPGVRAGGVGASLGQSGPVMPGPQS